MFAKPKRTRIEDNCADEIVLQVSNLELPSDCEHGLTYCKSITSTKEGRNEVLGENEFLVAPLLKSTIQNAEFISLAGYRLFVQIEDRYEGKNVRLYLSEGKIRIELDARL